MGAQRIKTGFRRIAIVGATLCAIPGAATLAFGLWMYAVENPNWEIPTVYGVLFSLGAAAIYVTARTLGWIIAGFAGDGEISN